MFLLVKPKYLRSIEKAPRFLHSLSSANATFSQFNRYGCRVISHKLTCNHLERIPSNRTVGPKANQLYAKQILGSSNKRFTTVLGNASSTSSSRIVSQSNSIVHGPDKLMGYWLLAVGGAVFGMILLGGITRLTRSGLSMVDWNLEGRALPSSEEQWNVEFEKYKQFPEYKLKNQKMTLAEFKKIYFLEWLHRWWGRGLGIVYGVPMIYFLITRKSVKTRMMLAGLFALGGSQGLVGWWMVKSGLVIPTVRDPVTGEIVEKKHWDPRVSAYRLATHLTLAMILYTALLWSGLSALNPKNLMNPLTFQPVIGQKMRIWSAITWTLAGITFVSGAFVAGNDAGHAYNDWPMYAGKWIPDEAWDYYQNVFSSIGKKSDISIAELFENTGVVQFNHRHLAYSTFTAAMLLQLFTLPQGISWSDKKIRLATRHVGLFAALQVALGITTLMLIVPTELAISHQGLAIVFYTSCLYLNHAIRFTV